MHARATYIGKGCRVSTTGEVVAYDLANPPLLGARQRARLESAVRRSARAVAALASDYLAVPVTMVLDGITDSRHRAPHAASPHPSLWVFPDDRHDGDAPVWRFSRPLASTLVHRMLASSACVEESELTRLQRRLLVHLCGEMFPAWAATWPTPVARPAAWRCIRDGSDLSEPSPDQWVKLALTMAVDDLTGSLDLHLPVEMARLPAPEPASNAFVPTRLDSPAVRDAGVTARVQLGTWRGTVGDLRSMRVGDVVSLGVPDQAPLRLSIAGHDAIPVRPGISNGRVAVQLTGGSAPAPKPGGFVPEPPVGKSSPAHSTK